jgi:hypothetical protein
MTSKVLVLLYLKTRAWADAGSAPRHDRYIYAPNGHNHRCDYMIVASIWRHSANDNISRIQESQHSISRSADPDVSASSRKFILYMYGRAYSARTFLGLQCTTAVALRQLATVPLPQRLAPKPSRASAKPALSGSIGSLAAKSPAEISQLQIRQPSALARQGSKSPICAGALGPWMGLL